MIAHVNGIELYYEVHGDGRPMILVHGNGETHEIFDTIILPLAEHYTVYTLDLRGHGQSSPTAHYHYQDMADDIYAFIKELDIESPIFYGFSDGGIIGLLIASAHPQAFSRLIVSGSNTTPAGVKLYWRLFFCRLYLKTKDDKICMMLREPHITSVQLSRITVPTLILAGEKDIVKHCHTKRLACAISTSTLTILPGEDHASYVIGSAKLVELITAFDSQK